MGAFPPADYIKIESGMEGFEVYKPAPKRAEEYPPIVVYTCPQCGASMAYDIASGGLHCSHCGYEELPEVNKVGKSAEQFEFTLETLEQVNYGWGVERLDLECQNCGARVSISSEQMTHTCAFCGSNKVILSCSQQDFFRPRYLIPFQVKPDTCQEIVTKWLSGHWMTPAALKSLVNLQTFSEIYLPYWTFDSETSAKWQAEVGHPEAERYYDPSDRTWKTRTKINWRWESGSVHLKIDDLLVTGTRRVSSRHLLAIQNYNLHALVTFDPGFLAGMRAQSYDVSLEAAWEVARQEMREKTRQACRKQASTSLIRNFRMDMDFNDETWRFILMPIFLAAYKYDGKVYQVLVNGQTGTISGQRPVDWAKVWLVIAALLAPGVLLSILGLATLPLGGIGVPIGGVGLFLFVVGLVIGIIVLIKANQLDDV